MTALKLALSGFAFSLAFVASAQTVYIDGRQVSFSGSERPYLRGATVMVPFRTMASRAGVRWSSSDSGRRLVLNWRDNSGAYTQGQSQMTINGRNSGIGYRSEERDDTLFVSATIFSLMTDNRVTFRRDNSGGGWGGSGGSNSGGGWGGSNGSTSGGDWGGNWDNNRSQITFEGRVIQFSGNEYPIRSGNSYLVPARRMADVVHASLERTADGKRMWIRLFGDEAMYDKNARWFRLNGKDRNLPHAARERDGVYFVPIEIFRDLTRGAVRWR